MTSIGGYAFYECNKLKTVAISESSRLTSIGSYAFCGCNSLTSITIPVGVTSLGEGAFQTCNKLSSIYYTGDVAGWLNIEGLEYLMTYGTSTKKLYIGGQEFSGEIVIPDGITEIPAYAFYICSNLTSVTIPDSVKSIGICAFYNCTKLSTVTITENSQLTSISGWAFNSCSSLTSITIPDGVTSIGSSAFNDCSSLTSITIPDGVTSISEWAFIGCRSLTSIKIPDGVTSIENSTFQSCYNLSIVIFGANSQLDTIDDYAFNCCNSLVSIIIPDSVTSINIAAFQGCNNLSTVYYLGTETQWNEISLGDSNDCLINATRYYYSETKPTQEGNFWHLVDGDIYEWTWGESKTFSFETYGAGEIAEKIVPVLYELPEVEKDGYYFIGWYDNAEFEGNRITTPYCPETDVTLYVKWIDMSSQSAGLEISDGMITGIGTCTDTELILNMPVASNTFNGCDSITEIVLGESVTSIGEQAFYQCTNLATVSISDTCKLTSIGRHAFGSCGNLSSIDLPKSVTSIDEYAFSGCNNLVSIIFKGDMADWCGISGLKYLMPYGESTKQLYIDGQEITGELVISDGVSVISSCAFYNYCGITSITIADSVTSIGNMAFYNCSNLKTITIGENSRLTNIGEWAFYCCGNLTSIAIPDSVTSIGDYAFTECGYLTTVTFGENSQLVTIGDGAFNCCYDLTSIIIPNGITSIGESTFNYCLDLTSIIIPDGVTSIGNSAFISCSQLSTVYYMGTETQWNGISVGNDNDNLTNANIYYYSESEPALNDEETAYAGNFWHLVDGKPVAWVKETETV